MCMFLYVYVLVCVCFCMCMFLYMYVLVCVCSCMCFSPLFLDGIVVKNPPANAGDARDSGSIPGLGRPPGVGNGNPLQYFCLENPMDRGAWWAIQSLGSQRVGHD